MIISHRHRYLFIETPLTGSTAISRELEAKYDGFPILSKHASYWDFEPKASEEEKQYFVFAGVRNPLDQAVSTYMKYKTNHRSNYTDPEKLHRRGRWIAHVKAKRFRLANAAGNNFEQFLLKTFRWPFVSKIAVNARHCDFVIRYEHLSEDFEKALNTLGIASQRQLPVANQTRDKGNFVDFYESEAARRHAVRVFSPYMREWGYEFPDDWNVGTSGFYNSLYPVTKQIKSFYWKNIRSVPFKEDWPKE